MGKNPKSIARLDKREPVSKGKKDKKRPVSSQSHQESFMNETPFWSFKRLDNAYNKWQINEASELLNALKAFEGMTWQQICSAAGGKSKGHGSNSHFIPISSLIKEAQDRLAYLNLDTEDVVFSLRIGNTKRIWGLLRSRALEIIWYDENHEICDKN